MYSICIMVEEKKLEIINRLAQFVINRTTEDIRDELQEYLISIAVLESSKGSSVDDICIFLENKVGVKDFPNKIVEDGIKRLLKKRKINIFSEENNIIKYQLASSVEKKFSGFSNEYNATIEKIFNNLFNKIEKECRRLQEDEKKSIKYNILLSFGNIFNDFGAEVASIFYKGKLKDFSSLKVDKLEKELEKNLSNNIKGKNVIICIIEHLNELIKKPSMEFARFLFSISQAYYLIQILNLDPDGQKLIKSKLQSKLLYLDTNVLINLIFDTEKKGKKIGKKELDIAKTLNFEVFVTNRTIEEFTNWMSDHKKLTKIVEDIEISRFEKTKNILEDGALKEFFLKKQKQPSLTWDGYLAKFDKIEELIREKYGINVDNSFYDKIKGEEKKITELVPIVQYYSYNKHDNVANHDAGHIVFIQKLREDADTDILGPNSWFLTNDSSLQKVEKDYHPKVIPSSIFGAYWTQMILPFLSPDISKQEGPIVFARIFGSSLTSSHIIDEKIWLKIQGPWLDTEGLSSDMIEDIIGTKYIQELLNKKKIDEIEQEELNLALDKAFIDGFKKKEKENIELSKEKNILVQKHSKEINELKKEIGKTSTKIEKIENFQNTRRSGIKKDKRIAKLASFLLFFIFLSIDLAIYLISPNLWNLTYQILITVEFAIFMTAFGIYEWLKIQFKKLEEF